MFAIGMFLASVLFLHLFKKISNVYHSFFLSFKRMLHV